MDTPETDNTPTAVTDAGTAKGRPQRLISRRYRCGICGQKGRHSKVGRYKPPICPACREGEVGFGASAVEEIEMNHTRRLMRPVRYDGVCSHCGRSRVELLVCGLRVCEQCHWDQDSNDYCSPSMSLRIHGETYPAMWSDIYLANVKGESPPPESDGEKQK